MAEKKTIWERWTDRIKKKSETRPDNSASYGTELDKTNIVLPKSVAEQLKLVNMMGMLDDYPNDWRVKIEFLNEIIKYTTYLGQPVTIDMLGYEGCNELIALYCDLLLRPLSLRAAEKIERTITTLLPAQTDFTE